MKGNKEKKPKDEDSKAIQAGDEPSSGYIHVRARRGQATDSHSLAERVFLDVSFIYLFIYYNYHDRIDFSYTKLKWMFRPEGRR